MPLLPTGQRNDDVAHQSRRSCGRNVSLDTTEAAGDLAHCCSPPPAPVETAEAESSQETTPSTSQPPAAQPFNFSVRNTFIHFDSTDQDGGPIEKLRPNLGRSRTAPEFSDPIVQLPADDGGAIESGGHEVLESESFVTTPVTARSTAPTSTQFFVPAPNICLANDALSAQMTSMCVEDGHLVVRIPMEKVAGALSDSSNMPNVAQVHVSNASRGEGGEPAAFDLTVVFRPPPSPGKTLGADASGRFGGVPSRSAHAFNPHGTAKGGSGGSWLVCRHWKSKGTCKFEASCKFSHPPHKRGVGSPMPPLGGGSQSPEKSSVSRGGGARGRKTQLSSSSAIAGSSSAPPSPDMYVPPMWPNMWPHL